MSHSQLVILSVILFFLIILSGFFSLAETGLMAANRYRLRHKARLNDRKAILVLNLLKRPDKLLGMILIGNNFANILASAIATMIAMALWGEKGVIVSTIFLTFIVLIFAEMTPKTLAAIYPDQIARTVGWPVYFSLIVFYPLVLIISFISNGLLSLFHIKVSSKAHESLTREELRSVVFDTGGKMSRQYQNMLLGVLDLNKASVDDVMIPKHLITGIDTDQDWEEIKKELGNTHHDRVPIYSGTINEVIGILHMREFVRLLVAGEKVDKEIFIKLLREPYFIPEGTPLNVQLLNFQKQKKRMALVVDEYGEVKGLITLEDILEEIVGEFTTNVISDIRLEIQPDGSYIVDGAITLRELNRVTKWHLPTDGPRTLNGLVIEWLESMPVAHVCIKISGYVIEVKEVNENRVAVAQIFPPEL